jgi:hypothetical protein
VQLEVNGHLGIELFDIDWQKFPADAKKWQLIEADGNSMELM